MCVWGYSRLQSVWMQHQQRLALDSRFEDRRTASDRAHGAEFSGRGIGGKKTPRRVGVLRALARRSLRRPNLWSGADSNPGRRGILEDCSSDIAVFDIQNFEQDHL